MLRNYLISLHKAFIESVCNADFFLILRLLQMKTGCVALVLCLNITVDPPDVIKISPCARIEAWIG